MANKIKEFREALGLSQVKLSKRTDANSCLISLYERDLHPVPPKHRKQIAAALGKTETEVFPDVKPNKVDVQNPALPIQRNGFKCTVRGA